MKSLSVILIFFLIQHCYCQELVLSTKKRKAKNAFKAGLAYYINFEKHKAKEQLFRAIEIDSNFIEAYSLLADIFAEEKNYSKAIAYYEKCIEINPDFEPRIFYLLGNLLLKEGFYERALKNFEQFLTYQNIHLDLKQKAQRSIERCSAAIELVKNPVPFEPKNLGANINTFNSEYSPTLTADEQILYFTVRRRKDRNTLCATCTEEEDFYISIKKNGEWQKAQPLGRPINSNGNEGAASISADGSWFYFTACDREDSYGSCDIYYSKKEKGRWSQPVNLGSVVNSEFWDSHPSISADGKSLYFASAREGQMDIYVSIKDEKGNWTKPINLGKPINTLGVEMSPFIHPDGKTLYFMSDSHPGLGGLDIFFSQKINDTTWSEPKNIGYPINTHKDEGFFIVNAWGDKAYFSSDQIEGFGKMDLYVIDLPESVRPTPVTYFKGIISDKVTGKKISATFELYDLKTSQLIVQSKSDEVSGEFLICLPAEKNYALNVFKEGYLFYSESFFLEGKHSQLKPYIKNILLQPINKDEIVILKNVFFDFDKDILKEESKIELNKLVELLNQHKTMVIELRGHTDNIGSAEYNKKLSLRRAQAVYNYLIEKGIDKRRLLYKGFGAEQPIDTNDTEEGRANNRRTEFRIVEF